MRTHVLRIIAISLLGVCLLCSLAKMGMKNENSKKTCDNACGMLMFVALALIGVSQLNDEEENYGTGPGPGLRPGKKCGPAGSCWNGTWAGGTCENRKYPDCDNFGNKGPEFCCTRPHHGDYKKPSPADSPLDNSTNPVGPSTCSAYSHALCNLAKESKSCKNECCPCATKKCLPCFKSQ